MSDGRPKPAIPAWQRAALPRPAATDDPVYSQPEKSHAEGVQTASNAQHETATSSEEPEPVPGDDTSPTTAPTAESTETKAITFEASDFESFTQHQPVEQEPPRPPPPQIQQRPVAPPIITYPEFLVDAHKPPPLITPSRIINTLYVAGGVTAMLYGASKWIVSPMVEALSDARHDFLCHSQSKVDEFNERLSKLVSKIPDGEKKVGVTEQDMEDAGSETSDPTELYHRDMGTQTSPLPSRRPSIPDPSAQQRTDPVAYETGGLETLRSHLDAITTAAESTTEASKDRQGAIDKLRHYLDSLMYGNAGVLWQPSDDAVALKSDAVAKDDPIEELKKEIRGVKGVLLSAKRFPAVNRPVTGTA